MTKSDITVTKLAMAPVEHDPFVSEAGLELDATPSQRAMWTRAQQSPEASCVYNETFSITLRGDVNEDVLVSALQTLPVLHACIRAHFSSDGRRMFIRPELDWSVTRHDLSSLSPSERDTQLAELNGACARTPYDLEHGPLFRASVITVSTHQSTVLLGAHHIVCDGWSLDVLLDDLGKIYSGMVGTGQFPNPARPTVVDFEAFRATDDCRERRTRALGYWKEQMQSAPNAGALSVEGPPAAGTSFPVRCGAHTVGAAHLASVKAFAKRNGLSLFTVQFAAFTTLLHRRTTLPDLMICVPVARHPEAEMENTVGNFVHLVPVRCKFQADTSFLALCKLAHTQLLDARENAAVGVDEITSALDPADEAHGVPTPVARFVPIHKYSEAELRFGNVSVDYDAVPRQFDGYELSLSIMQQPDSFEVLASAHAGNHSSEWLESCLREFEVLLVNGCNDSGSRLADLECRDFAETIRVTSSVPADRPTTDVELKLAELFSEKLKRPNVGVRDDFFQSGGDIKVAAALIKEVNRVFELTLGVEDLVKRPTVSSLAELAQAGVSKLYNMVVPLNVPGEKPPMYFVCGIALYRPLAKNLNDAYACYGIYVAEEESFFESQNEDDGMSIPELAALYIEAIKEHSSTGPYTIGGVSFGGILAFEVARQLRAAGDDVSGIVLLDAVLPGALQRDWMRTKNMVVERLKRLRSEDVLKRIRSEDVLGRLGELSGLGRFVARSGPGVSEREARNDQLWRAVRGKATTTYFEDNPTTDVPTLLVRATEQANLGGHRLSYDLCWAPKLKGAAIFADAPGSHLGILRSEETAQLIRKHIKPLPPTAG